MAAKKQTYYIPVTMDELMARFVTNMVRSECEERFQNDKQVLFKNSLSEVPNEQIEEGVCKSFSCL